MKYPSTEITPNFFVNFENFHTGSPVNKSWGSNPVKLPTVA